MITFLVFILNGLGAGPSFSRSRRDLRLNRSSFGLFRGGESCRVFCIVSPTGQRLEAEKTTIKHSHTTVASECYKDEEAFEGIEDGIDVSDDQSGNGHNVRV